MQIDASKQIEVFKDFIEKNYKSKIHDLIREGKKSLLVDFLELSSFDVEVSEQLLEEPEETSKAAEYALSQIDVGESNLKNVRFYNIPKSQIVMIKDIRSLHLNKFMALEGIVRQASDVRPHVTLAKFECPSCGNTITVPQIESTFREPSRCSCGRKGKFRLLSKDLVDIQRLLVEEIPESLEGGEQPKRIHIFLKEDLVEPKMEKKTTPGSKIRVFGVVKEVPLPSKSGGTSTTYDLMIDANFIEPIEEAYVEIEIGQEEIEEIKKLASDPRIYEKLLNSIAPSIYGHNDIKEALVLQLFGGVKKLKEDGTQTRGDCHVLLIGDPGAGKSATLQFISKAAPKGRFVSGRGASGAGITASVVKDDFLRGWALEAGAMVLANKGICVIDELDKMSPEDRSALHEAMEQQCMLPDFKLLLSDGRQVAIGPLVDYLIENNKENVYKGRNCEILEINSLELISTDFNEHFPLRANRISRHLAPKEFIKIELANGREITVTPEHPCWIVKDGKITTTPADRLKEGMFFSVPSKIDIKTDNYKKENSILCKILGYHISDGCYELNRGKKVGIQFWNNDELLINDYKKAVESYFNINTIIVRRKKQFAVRVISKSVVNKLSELDKKLLERGDIKEIPEKIMQFPNQNIKHILRGIYDGDGSVIFQKRNGCRISLVSQNKKLIEQVSDLLLRFAITSSIFWDNYSKVWRLDISGQENISKFHKDISFLSTKKRLRLKEYLAKSKTYRTIRDLVPNCTDKIHYIFKELKISARKEIGYSIDLGVQKHRIFLQKLFLIAKNTLSEKKGRLGERYFDILKDLKELEKTAFGYARWVKIKKVSKIKNKDIKWVYDVTIEPYRTFISNGMILHNTITISKANIQATLRAETTILAAANPKLGRFDPYQPIAAQIDLPPTLINRFDLIFPVKDIPNKDLDEKIAKHVLTSHQKPRSVESEIPIPFLKKYIAYVKQNIFPTLTEGSIEEITDFYVGLRNTSSTMGENEVKPIPITARQLEALIRLSEASARIRLSDKVLRKDSKRAIDLLKHCLMQVGIDRETGQIDIDRISTGIPATTRSKIITIREIINELEGRFGKTIPLEQVVAEATKKGIEEDKVEEIVENLKRSGDLFEPKRGFIQKI